MAMLIENGFVEVIESGKTSRTKSIYMLSDKWKEKRQPMAKFIKCTTKMQQSNDKILYTSYYKNVVV